MSLSLSLFPYPPPRRLRGGGVVGKGIIQIMDNDLQKRGATTCVQKRPREWLKWLVYSAVTTM